MAISPNHEIIGHLQAGKAGEIPLDMHQPLPDILADIQFLLTVGLAGNTHGLQYQHPMGDWRDIPWEDTEKVLTDHIKPPLERHYSSFESTAVSKEGIVRFGRREEPKGGWFNRQQVVWTVDVHLDEYNRLGAGSAFHDRSINDFRMTQTPGEYHTPHTLRIRQIAR